MSNKLKNNSENGEKRMTNYDRKQEAKKRQAEIERKNRIFSWIGIAAVCICIIGVILYSAISSAMDKKAALNDAYIMVGEHEVTKNEYEYYYNYTVNSYLNYLSSIGLLSYTGLDTSVDFNKQQYSATMTWKDAFDQMTVDQLLNSKMLVDDARVNGFEYDTSAEYEEFKASIAENADEASVSIKEYYKAAFGNYATEQNIKPFVLNEYIAAAYQKELLEQYKPDDEEVTSHYEENKDDYDIVDYRSFTFTAEIEDEATEEEINAAMAELKEKAEAMKAEREAGNDFEVLCLQYASEDEKEDYEDEENEYSLSEGITKSNISSYYSDWLYENNRNAGDITVIKDEDNFKYYVVEFVQRVYDENCRETISNKLSNESLNDYMDELAVNYEVKDIRGDLIYLTIEQEDEE